MRFTNLKAALHLLQHLPHLDPVLLRQLLPLIKETKRFVSYLVRRFLNYIREHCLFLVFHIAQPTLAITHHWNLFMFPPALSRKTSWKLLIEDGLLDQPRLFLTQHQVTTAMGH